ncbi:MAG: hypothetical protein JOS17DRAFT_793371 [Linnemannia elongata]|nr:MAG: hypothetical protein JOS17DRAFT_793371 [Linnemannia elongata]
MSYIDKYTLRSQNLTKAQAKTRADEAKDTIKILKKDLKPVKEQPTAAEKKQAAAFTTTSTTTSKPATIISIPTLESPAILAYVVSASLKTLLQDVVNPDQEFSIGSSDRGLKCEAAGSGPSDKSLGEQDLATTERLLVKYNPPLPKKQLLQLIKFPNLVKIAAKQNSLHRGQTAEEIEQAQTVRISQRKFLREFEQAPARTKDRHHTTAKKVLGTSSTPLSTFLAKILKSVI